MRKRLFAFIFTIAMSTILGACPAYAQSSQMIEGDIPFEFTANNRTLPAGTYRVQSEGSGSRVVWTIQSSDHQAGVFLMALTLTGSSDPNIRLTFHRYGDKHFLVGFKTHSYDVTLPATKAEKALRVESEPLRETDAMDIETVTARSH